MSELRARPVTYKTIQVEGGTLKVKTSVAVELLDRLSAGGTEVFRQTLNEIIVEHDFTFDGEPAPIGKFDFPLVLAILNEWVRVMRDLPKVSETASATRT